MHRKSSKCPFNGAARSLRPRTDLAAFQHDQIQYMVVWNPQSHYILWHIGGGSFCRADS